MNRVFQKNAALLLLLCLLLLSACSAPQPETPTPTACPTGDAELDAYLDETLRQLCEDDPADAGDREALLRRAYEHVMTEYRYLGRGGHTDGEGWEERDGKSMLETGRGDCYDYAALFTLLARSLGFEARGVIGTLEGMEEEHAWTEIVFDGSPLLYDPLMEKRDQSSRYALSYEQAAALGYPIAESQG